MSPKWFSIEPGHEDSIPFHMMVSDHAHRSDESFFRLAHVAEHSCLFAHSLLSPRPSQIRSGQKRVSTYRACLWDVP